MLKLESDDDIENLKSGYVYSAAFNLALELGLFWNIENEKKADREISGLYDIPFERTKTWLELLAKMDLLDRDNSHYKSSELSKNTFMKKYSENTWSLLAQEAREQYYAIINLTEHISHPKSVWESQGIKNISYVTKMEQDKNRAERFTRMLYEIHMPLAELIANKLDMKNVNTLLDLGGGSGIISFAFLRKNNDLIAKVFDLETVCVAGRKIARESGLDLRITYLGGNFILDKLPSGNDLVIECDVGVYSEELFAKIRESLNPNGRFVIVTNTNEQGAWLQKEDEQPSLKSLMYEFMRSLGTDKITGKNSEDLKIMLKKVGFSEVKIEYLDEGVILIEAVKSMV